MTYSAIVNYILYRYNNDNNIFTWWSEEHAKAKIEQGDFLTYDFFGRKFGTCDKRKKIPTECTPMGCHNFRVLPLSVIKVCLSPTFRPYNFTLFSAIVQYHIKIHK
ncbi:hypothetical protein BDC45DRAFT_541068 [Circinella umbellata]|nr:hypothetical protein BDC45DRAFT_541068 [Circinella umbellata]